MKICNFFIRGVFSSFSVTCILSCLTLIAKLLPCYKGEPLFTQSFPHCWTLKKLLFIYYLKQCCREHSWACTFVNRVSFMGKSSYFSSSYHERVFLRLLKILLNTLKDSIRLFQIAWSHWAGPQITTYFWATYIFTDSSFPRRSRAADGSLGGSHQALSGEGGMEWKCGLSLDGSQLFTIKWPGGLSSAVGDCWSLLGQHHRWFQRVMVSQGVGWLLWSWGLKGFLGVHWVPGPREGLLGLWARWNGPSSWAQALGFQAP